MKKAKIFNDPIYGFIRIRNPLVFDIVEHAYFQRLRRISQMGLSYLVYPGAHHTRFHHVIGCTYLMQSAIDTLRMKGVDISPEEEEALLLAILMHDMGHGPYSHALEGCFVRDAGHEELSLAFMEELNNEFNGRLDLAIRMFRGTYERPFMNELISSQLDMDRLDYLKRDSFYSGVAEGNLNSERLISMLCVRNDRLAILYKGIYSVEKFIMARRFMYWQVYLHKTGLAAEHILIKIIERVRGLLRQGENVEMSPVLRYFLQNELGPSDIDRELLDIYTKLDDSDLIQGMKSWCDHEDYVLRHLSRSILHRRLPKIELSDVPSDPQRLLKKREKTMERLRVSESDLDFLVYAGEVSNRAYKSGASGIQIALKNGKTVDLEQASDSGAIQALNQKITKYFICYPKKYS